MQAESSVDLLAAARRAGFEPDPTLPTRIGHAIAATDDRGELGRLYIARAIAGQCHGDATASATASCEAVPHLLASGQPAAAAFASAMAAVFLDQCDDMARAIEFAVDALVLLDDIAPGDIESVCASLALSGFFVRMSSFDTAVDMGHRAFLGAQKVEGVPLDSVAYTFGYVAAEAAHVTNDRTRRSSFLAKAIDAERWLRHHGSSAVATRLLAGGLSGGPAPTTIVWSGRSMNGQALALRSETSPEHSPMRNASLSSSEAGRSARSAGSRPKSPVAPNSNGRVQCCAPRPIS